MEHGLVVLLCQLPYNGKVGIIFTIYEIGEDAFEAVDGGHILHKAHVLVPGVVFCVFPDNSLLLGFLINGCFRNSCHEKGVALCQELDVLFNVLLLRLRLHRLCLMPGCLCLHREAGNSQ